jgi:putative effector of murein hydrolase LrgA (UPF0299 family)
MIRDLAVLLVCQLVGETAVRAAGLPLPGPVLGLMLLFAFLLWSGRRAASQPKLATVADGVGRTADRILGVLGLLFVPAGVGVVTELDLFGRYGAALAAALVVSVVATLLVTVAVFLAVKRLLPAEPPPGEAVDG